MAESGQVDQVDIGVDGDHGDGGSEEPGRRLCGIHPSGPDGAATEGDQDQDQDRPEHLGLPGDRPASGYPKPPGGGRSEVHGNPLLTSECRHVSEPRLATGELRGHSSGHSGGATPHLPDAWYFVGVFARAKPPRSTRHRGGVRPRP